MANRRGGRNGLTFGSLFAGVGGFDLGMESADWSCLWQVEWDKHCLRVLARHWPDVPRWGDVCDVNGAELPPVDCITFGSPCQDLSTAGKRAGLAGKRSGLFHQAIRIIEEMRDATGNEFPRAVIWENVAGAFSSNGGKDFGAVLEALANLGCHHIEWHCLDARWFGVPQRRRRVFVTAVFDPAICGRGGEPIFPVAARSGWHPPSGDTAREDVAGTLGGGSGNRGWAADTDRMTFVKVVRSGKRDADGNLPADVWREEPTAPTLNAFDNGTETRATILAFSHTQGIDAQPSDNVWPTLRREGNGQAVLTVAQVRRLTPLECERLMGWPDDHTRWDDTGRQLADSVRYRMIGNGVVAPVAQFIAKHLQNAIGAV